MKLRKDKRWTLTPSTKLIGSEVLIGGRVHVITSVSWQIGESVSIELRPVGGNPNEH